MALSSTESSRELQEKSLDDGLTHQPEASPEDLSASTVPVETLVTHLLAAKRALSSVTAVQRADSLLTTSRAHHEESILLTSQTAFLRRGISDQLRVLLRVRRGLGKTQDGRKKEFRALLKTLDDGGGRLEGTMEMLRGRRVESAFRPAGEEERSLLHFVDTDAVERLKEEVKGSLTDLQAAQTAFGMDIGRFDDDLGQLNEVMASAPGEGDEEDDENSRKSIPELMGAMKENSQSMAEQLSSLTRHFDMCVTAVRSTEGGSALARRRAAEMSISRLADPQGSAEPISISGVIADPTDLEPMSAEERVEVVNVVLQDAPEVEEVVADLANALEGMEADFASLSEKLSTVRAAHDATVTAFQVLKDLGGRLSSYVAAEAEFLERWDAERAVVQDKLAEMDELRRFYDGYAAAYDSLILEADRRRLVEDKVQSVWAKAQENVDRIIEGDKRERETFMEEIGEWLPTDLWTGMGKDIRRWEVTAADDRGEDDTRRIEDDTGDVGKRHKVPALSRSVVNAARERLGRATEAR
jgi:autophagy-related protein 17